MAFDWNRLENDFPLFVPSTAAKLSKLKDTLEQQKLEIAGLRQLLDSDKLDSTLQKVSFQTKQSKSLQVEELAALIAQSLMVLQNLMGSSSITTSLIQIEALDHVLNTIADKFKNIQDNSALQLLPKVIQTQSTKVVDQLVSIVKRLILANKRPLDPAADWSDYIDEDLLEKIPLLGGTLAVLGLFGWMSIQYGLTTSRKLVEKQLEQARQEFKKLLTFKLLSETTAYYVLKDPEFAGADCLDFQFNYLLGVRTAFLKHYTKREPGLQEQSESLGKPILPIILMLLSPVVIEKQEQIVKTTSVSPETKGNLLFTLSKHANSFLGCFPESSLKAWHLFQLQHTETPRFLEAFIQETLASVTSTEVGGSSHRS